MLVHPTTGGLWFRSLTVRRRRRDAKSVAPAARQAYSRLGQAGATSSSAATFLVRLGSTGTPGPIVVESVTFLM